MKSDLQVEVDRLFRQAPDRYNYFRQNPVTDHGFTADDPIGPQKQAAVRALKAREWFATHAPPDAPTLPLSYRDRERMKAGGLPHIVAWFARSLEGRDYNFDGHPPFNEYACGVMASPGTPYFIKDDRHLQTRFPPCALPGLDRHQYWNWPLASIREASRFQQQLFLQRPPPPPLWHQIPRNVANIPHWYAPWAQGLMQLDDEFIAHATGCAPCKRLPRGWRVDKPGEVFYRKCKNHILRVVASDHGWIIERIHQLNEHEEMLTHSLCNTPVLCPTHVLAARLADAAYPVPEPRYLLDWHSIQ